MTGLLIFVIAWMALIIGLFVWSEVVWFKGENTRLNHLIIMNAIHDYRMDCIRNHQDVYEVEYEDMRSYDDTKKRWWDWSYRHILPPEKFTIIEPYIKEDKK